MSQARLFAGRSQTDGLFLRHLQLSLASCHSLPKSPTQTHSRLSAPPPRSLIPGSVRPAQTGAVPLYRELQSRPFCNSDVVPRLIILN